jgi:hypothetical protein
MVHIFRAATGRIFLQVIHQRPWPHGFSAAASSPGPGQIIGTAFAYYYCKTTERWQSSNFTERRIGWRGPAGPLRRVVPSRQPGIFFWAFGEMYLHGPAGWQGNICQKVAAVAAARRGSTGCRAGWASQARRRRKGNHHLIIMGFAHERRSASYDWISLEVPPISPPDSCQ